MSASRKTSGLPFLPGYTFRDLTVGKKKITIQNKHKKTRVPTFNREQCAI